MKEKNRDIRLDFIRSVAIISVISVHFLLNSGFYETPLEGKRMFLMTIARTAFLPCVPLFIMLSGYLLRNKCISKKYYYGIWKTISIYLIASTFCLIFKILYLKQEMTIAGALLSVIGFTAVPYAWYINMYIGLFLLIPFLNVLYNNLDSKRSKQILIFTCIFIAIMPSFNIKYVIFPNWWVGIYPITYYFMGAYLSEYKVSVKKSINILLLVMSIFGFSLINFYLGYKSNFIEKGYTSYAGFECIIVTIMIFLLGLNLNFNNIPNTIQSVMATLSKLSLGMYLSSWIIDVIVYGKLNSNVKDVYQRVNYAPLVILCVIIGAAILSYCFNCISAVLGKLVSLYKTPILNKWETISHKL